MPFTEALSVMAGYTKIARRIGGGTIDQSALNNRLAGTRTGEKVIDFQKKILAGLQAGSPYSIDTYNVLNIPGQYLCKFKFNGSPTVWTDEFLGTEMPCISFAHNFSIPASLEDKALAKVLEKVRSTRSNQNGLVILGEARETLKMLRHPASALTAETTKYFRRLKNEKTRLHKVALAKRRDAWSRVITGTYLEYVFGVVPLISDIKDIARTLQRFVDDGPKRTRVKATARLETSSLVATPKHTVMASGLFMYSSFTTINVTEASTQYIVGLELQERLDESSLSRLLRLSGITLENFIPALYEIAPWSFLIDYFSNLGEVIASGTTDTSEVKWFVKTNRQRSSRLVSPLVESPVTNLAAAAASLVSYTGDFGRSQTIRTTLTRSIGTTLGTPKIHLTHPGDNVKKLLNIVALLEQQRIGSRDLSWLKTKGR